VLHPETLDAELAATGRAAPDTLWFLGLPYTDTQEALADLAPVYVVTRFDTVRDGGYAMPVIQLVRRGGIDTVATRPDVPMLRR
jgi:hypothetical protein